ncbi:isopentenyl-diphosphate delta-isomerase, type 2 [Gemella sanguinis M325]|jgi:isopentenyl-diphosphate delta-isomerase, type 2|uniref:Isopentenyl-diphosphate delta-isomerase n=1 Tax=Gemella sanguinis TaxID=84135 RepID=A0ABX6FGY1_9BACL|nr:type 2 isopentenyl-diphosphate Delta-isomerase [Gemella sanguinis]EGF88989.1 isopentenyl-diphosphate delta-isomerase, type 2 [Gemella sanguinis M325]QGS07759.1 type 2 isopentenyl-diphosphate Delta-isomerase [Gemella sanguinis]
MRKKDHIRLALADKTTLTSLDAYAIDYNSVPRFGLDNLDTSTTICNKKWQFPFFINAITAGGEECNKINQDFMEVSEACGIEFFPGSYSPALKDKNDEAAYPKGYSINLGLDKDPNLILDAIEKTKAQYIQLHTNPLQEIVMPEGDHNFESWLSTLTEVSKKSPIPVILKETGFGMNEETIKLAIDLNLAAVDVSGMGGTNFARIENGRREDKSTYLENIGYTTAESLEFATPYRDKIDIIASGGIRNPLDVVKCLALGAKAVGVSKTFLEILVNDGKEALIDEIEKWKKELKFLMILMNAKNIDELYGKIRKIDNI